MKILHGVPDGGEWEVEVPAGRYFLGDPGYPFPSGAHGRWMELLESTTVPGAGGYFDHTPVGTLDGHEVLAFGTRWGDGTFSDQEGHEYGVDAGMIGLVPEELVQLLDDGSKLGLEELGRFVVFETPVRAARDSEGTLVFGPYVIRTAEDEEDEDEDGIWGADAHLDDVGD